MKREADEATYITADDAAHRWDAISGRLTCVARLVVIVPGPAPDTRQRSEIEVRYRVTRDDADTFLVEIGYDDMMSLFPVRAVPGR